jgi:hypothetical protein
MMSCANCNTTGIEHLADIEMMDAFHREGKNGDFILCCADRFYAFEFRDTLSCVGEEFVFVSCNVFLTNEVMKSIAYL